MKTRVKDRLRTREMSFGSWLSLGSEPAAEIMARAGFEWLVVDMEHAPIGVAEAARLIRIVDLAGLPAICRLPSQDPALIKNVLDAGATGVMLPMIETREQAERAVAASRYPPNGWRGVGLGRAQGYGNRFEAYRAEQADHVVVVAMIETRPGVENVQAIAATPGIDGLLIGPYDLSGSLGHIGELNHPAVETAKRTILEAAEAAGIGSGLHVVHPSEASIRQAVRDRYSFLALGVDMILLDHAARRAVEVASETERQTK